MKSPDVLIVGAGLSGLSCAMHLNEAGLSYLLVEASDEVGGRVRTDSVGGFLLDRGFQVLLTAYPEAQAMLDYGTLDLKTFSPGALVRFQGRFYEVMDPWRRPLAALKTLFSPIGTLGDKFCLGRMRAHLMTCSTLALYDRPDVSAMQVLKEAGFSPNLIDRFFRPFMGGVFFDPDLHVSRRMFEFVFQMFSRGDTALPAHGMGAIPKQLASRLPGECVRLNAVVSCLKEGGAILDSGEEIRAKAVVIATHGPETARLLGDTAHPGSRSITCLYFAAQDAPVKKPTLVLDGDGKGPVMNLCVPSVVAPSYAPPGRALVSVTVSSGTSVADQELQAQVLGQMREWFGSEVDQWQHLKTYRIAHALPLQTSPVGNPHSNPVSIRTGLFTCGEYHNVASIQWALFSGRRVAEAVRAALKA